MSAKVITLPERKVSPDGALCTRLVEACNGDAGRLFDLAMMSVVIIRRQSIARTGGDVTRAETQPIVNRLFTAWLAIGEILATN